MPNYDSSKPNNWIIDLDANNFHEWALSQPLPKCDFRFRTANEMKTFNHELPQIDDEKGYILEVDLLYPQELYELHNDFPLAAEKLVINENILSEYGKHLG